MNKIPSVFLFSILSCLVAFTLPMNAQEITSTSSINVPESLVREGRAAIDRGVDWLVANQSDNGSFSNPKFPALTALPLWAMCESGRADSPAAKKAAAFVASCAKTDGSIYIEPDIDQKGGGLVNYNTAICMTALHLTGDAKYRPLVLKARAFIADSQHLGGDIYKGGFGYDAKTARSYTDLLNTSTTVEAMRITENAEDYRPVGQAKSDINWKELEKYVQRVQNDARFNKERPWVTDDKGEQGGFAYHPDQTRAGTHLGKDGNIKFRSMPGMTYAGLLSYIYADVERNDPRVQAAVDWIANNWDLEHSSRDPEKAGKDAAKEGVYYLYNILSKGMSAYGVDTVTPAEGKPFNWRTKVIEKLVSQQKIDAKSGGGYWINPVSRYWEGDKVLVTAYTLLALNKGVAGEE